MSDTAVSYRSTSRPPALPIAVMANRDAPWVSWLPVVWEFAPVMSAILPTAMRGGVTLRRCAYSARQTSGAE